MEGEQKRRRWSARRPNIAQKGVRGGEAKQEKGSGGKRSKEVATVESIGLSTRKLVEEVVRGSVLTKLVAESASTQKPKVSRKKKSSKGVVEVVMINLQGDGENE